MTDKQPEALRLAEQLEKYWAGELSGGREMKAAAELRRLHEENESLRGSIYGLYELERSNAELVEALQRVVRFLEVEDARLANFGEVEAARAALAKAQGENNE